MSENHIASDPLFVGLTRPPMVFGVSIQYALLNFMLSAILFIQKPSIYILLVSGIVHLIGYILYFNDPRFLELYINYNNKCSKATNTTYYGGAHSYKR